MPLLNVPIIIIALVVGVFALPLMTGVLRKTGDAIPATTPIRGYLWAVTLTAIWAPIFISMLAFISEDQFSSISIAGIILEYASAWILVFIVGFIPFSIYLYIFPRLNLQSDIFFCTCSAIFSIAIGPPFSAYALYSFLPYGGGGRNVTILEIMESSYSMIWYYFVIPGVMFGAIYSNRAARR